MSSMELFHGHRVRTQIKNGQVRFALQDICDILGTKNVADVKARLKEAYIDVIDVWSDTQQRYYATTFVNERGLIRVLQTSRSPLVSEFQDWADERVEQLLKGQTVNASGIVESEDALILRAITTLQERVAEQSRQLEVVLPKAQAYETFLDAKGSVDVQRAAQLLTRAGIQTGQNRLFDYLDEIGWTSKPRGRSRRAKQKAVEQGLLELKATGYENPRTGEWVVKDPQIRITPKGLEKLRYLMLPSMEALIAEGDCE